MKRLIAALLTFMICLALYTAYSEEGERFLNILTEPNTITLYYSNEEGQKIPGPEGYAQIEYLYQGKSATPYKIRYLNETSERTLNPMGYSVVKYEFDKKGRISEATFYGPNKKICENND